MPRKERILKQKEKEIKALVTANKSISDWVISKDKTQDVDQN